MTARDKKPYRILTLEGGGIYTLSYLPILEELERFLNGNIAKSQQFQKIVSFSTGSIIGTALKLGVSATEIRQFYLQLSRTVLAKNRLSDRLFYFYKTLNLQKALHDFFGNLTWNDLKKYHPEVELTLLLWSVSKRRFVWLSTHTPFLEEDFTQTRLADILTASSADPFYFAPILFHFAEKGQIYSDGGILLADNPDFFLEKMIPQEAEEVHLFSLGNGENCEDISTKTLRYWTSADINLNTLQALLGARQHSWAEVLRKQSKPIRVFRTNQSQKFPQELQEVSLDGLLEDFSQGHIYGRLFSSGMTTSFVPLTQKEEKGTLEPTSSESRPDFVKMRQESANFAEEIQPEEWLPTFMKAFHEKNDAVIWGLFEKGSEYTTKEMLAGWLDLLKKETYAQKKHITLFLEQLKDGQKFAFASILFQILQEGSVAQQREASWWLAPLAIEKFVPTFGEKLEHKDPIVRKNMAWALGLLKEKAESVLPRLFLLLEDEESDVRQKGAWAIALISVASGTEKLVPYFIFIGKWSKSSDSIKKEMLWIFAEVGLGTSAKEVLPLLFEALNSPFSSEVRHWVSLALQKIKETDADALDFILAQTQQSQLKAKSQAFWALSQLSFRHEKIDQAFLSVLETEEKTLYPLALEVLSQRRVAGILPKLIAWLQEDLDESLRKTVRFALGYFGPQAKEAVPVLINWIKEGDPTDRRDAAWLLGEIQATDAVPYLKKMLQEEEFQILSSAVFTIGDLNPDSERTVPTLLDALLREDYSTLRAAIVALGKMGTFAAPAIIDLALLLRNRNEFVREEVARTLGKLGDVSKNAVPELIESLDDISERVRAKVAWALGQIGAKEAVVALTKMEKEETSPEALHQIQNALNVMGRLSSEVLQHLWAENFALEPQTSQITSVSPSKLTPISSVAPIRVQGLRPVWYKRHEIAVGLLFIATLLMFFHGIPTVYRLQKQNEQLSQDFLKNHIKILLSEDWNLRVEAANKLLEMGEEAVPALIQGLKDKQLEVRQTSAQVLSQLGPPAVPALIRVFKESEQETQHAALFALIQIGPASVSALLRTLQETEEGRRLRMIEALGEIRSSQAVLPLSELLQKTQNHWELLALIGALGKIGDAQALPALQRLFYSENKEVAQLAKEVAKQLTSD